MKVYGLEGGRSLRLLVVLALVTAALIVVSRPAAASDGCLPTGYLGLTAHTINEDVVGGTLEVACDIGAFFDQPGTVSGATFLGTVANQKPVQYAVLAVGTSVDVTSTSVSVEPAYTGQFISIGYRDGATGTVSRSTISGAHRVGVLVRAQART